MLCDYYYTCYGVDTRGARYPGLISYEALPGGGAVRFISGTYASHIELEKRLAAFHQRASAMIYSAAYAAITGVLPPIINDNTLIISDQLNHNSIINAIRLSRPVAKEIYPHLDMIRTRATEKTSHVGIPF